MATDSLDMTDPEVRRAKLNTETARIPWRELQRYFAAGNAVAVDPGLDLLAVGDAFLTDDTAAVEAWIEQGGLGPVSDAQAAEWYEANALMWAVVLPPWVLVQPLLAESSR